MVSLQATLDSSARASNRRECFFPLTFLNRPPNSKIIVRVLMVGAGLLSDPAVVLEFGYRHEFGTDPNVREFVAPDDPITLHPVMPSRAAASSTEVSEGPQREVTENFVQAGYVRHPLAPIRGCGRF